MPNRNRKSAYRPVKQWHESGRSLPEYDSNDVFAAAEKWSLCVESAQKIDRTLVTSWQDEMNTVLVFSALFSAVVTAFLIESYQWLQADPTNDTVALLTLISDQLGNRSSATQAFQLPSSSYTPSRNQVAVNALWFSSLVISLSTVMLAILIKQWLVDYTWPVGTASSRQTVAVRQARFESFHQWNISTFIDIIPLLIIISLFAFFAGLMILLQSLSTVVWGLSLGCASLAVTFFVFTSVLPSIFPRCAYRSIQSSLVYGAVNLLAHRGSWVHGYIRDIMVDKKSAYDASALMWILRYVCPWDPPMYSNISTCARSLDKQTAAHTVCSLYLNSTANTGIVLTEEHALAWKNRLGDSEFEACCSTLVQATPDAPWTGGGMPYLDDLSERLQVMCLLLSTWLRSMPKREPALMRNALKVLIDLVTIDDKRLSQLSQSQESQARSAIFKVLLEFGRHQWPSGKSAVPVHSLIKNLSSALIRQAKDGEHTSALAAIFLSYCGYLDAAGDGLAPSGNAYVQEWHEELGIDYGNVRPESKKFLKQSVDEIHLALKFMTEFIIFHQGGTNVQLLRDVVKVWVEAIFTTIPRKWSSYRHENDIVLMRTKLAFFGWDSEPVLADSMRTMLQALMHTESLDTELWSGCEQFRDRLALYFGNFQEASGAYLSSVSYTGISDPYSEDHAQWWNNTITLHEREHLFGVLSNSIVSSAPGAKSIVTDTQLTTLRMLGALLVRPNHGSFDEYGYDEDPSPGSEFDSMLKCTESLLQLIEVTAIQEMPQDVQSLVPELIRVQGKYLIKIIQRTAYHNIPKYKNMKSGERLMSHCHTSLFQVSDMENLFVSVCNVLSRVISTATTMAEGSLGNESPGYQRLFTHYVHSAVFLLARIDSNLPDFHLVQLSVAALFNRLSQLLREIHDDTPSSIDLASFHLSVGEWIVALVEHSGGFDWQIIPPWLSGPKRGEKGRKEVVSALGLFLIEVEGDKTLLASLGSEALTALHFLQECLEVKDLAVKDQWP